GGDVRLGTVSMNMARIESHPGLFGNPYMDTKSKTHEANPQKGFVVQINASENFGLVTANALHQCSMMTLWLIKGVHVSAYPRRWHATQCPSALCRNCGFSVAQSGSSRI